MIFNQTTYKPYKNINEVDIQFNKFLAQCHRCKDAEQQRLIQKAYEFMKEAFGNRKRHSGDLFAYHNFAVARIVGLDIGLDASSVIAALLHDIVAETDTTSSDINFIFGEQITELVKSLTNIKGSFQFFTANKTDYYKQMLLSVPDVRVIYIKIADRLDNMRTIFALKKSKQIQIAQETLLVYAPFSEVLGLYSIKQELEDRAFAVLNPEKYNYILNHIQTNKRKSMIYLNRVSLPIIKVLFERGYDFSIHSRQKSIYSIYKKIIRKKVSIDDIYDIYAMRVIIRSANHQIEKQQCYEVEKIIKSIYPQCIKERRRDWIANPKNDYEALHITIKALGRWLEVQIRSQRMHDIAEHGVAAHYKYKGVNIEKLVFKEKLKQLVEHIKNFDLDFNQQMFEVFKNDKIVVYTRKGEPLELPKGCTAVDFAFFIDPKLAEKFIGVKINGKLQKPDYILQSGDRVEIITYDKKEPTKDLLGYITVPEFLIKYSKILTQNELAKKGEHIFKNLLLRNNFKETEKNNLILQLMKKYSISYEFEFYERLAVDSKFLKKVDNYLRSKNQSFFSLILGKRRFKHSTIELADCCKPMPNDEVFYIREGDKIILHKKNCKKVVKYVEERKIKPQVLEIERVNTDNTIFVKIIFRAEDIFGLYYSIAQIFYKDLNLNLKRVCITTEHNEVKDDTDKILHNPIKNYVAGEIDFYIKDKEYLKVIEQKLKSIEAIYYLSINADKE